MPKLSVAMKPASIKIEPAGRPARRGRQRRLAGSIAAWFGKLRADRGGAVMPVLALSLPIIIGFAGLGTEAASWYLTKRTMQGAADAAASTAAASLAAGTTSASTLATDAKSIAAHYNFVNGNSHTTVTVNYPPTSGTYQGSSSAVEVSISKQEPALLSSLFLSQGPTINAHAVALANLTYEACVIALDNNNETAMTTSGNPNLSFPGCSLYANSPAAAALNLSGSASINAYKAYFVGNYSGGGLTTTTNGIYTGVNPIIDPYRNVAVPAYSACDSANKYTLSAGQSATKSVGASGVYVFCKGVKLTGNSSLTLVGPGTFIIDGGAFDITSGSVTATGGTTIILTTKLSGQPCATANITSGPINITAPTSGSLAGIAIYKDRACVNHNSDDDKVTGNSTQNIVGAIYFPEQWIDYSGGSSTGGARCTQLIAWKITFTGTSGFQSTCADTGTRKLNLTGGQLVE
jgi:Flp pilus assembly protein TadG